MTANAMMPGSICNQNDERSIQRLQRYLVQCVGGGDGEPVPNVSLTVAIPGQASIKALNIFDKKFKHF